MELEENQTRILEVVEVYVQRGMDEVVQPLNRHGLCEAIERQEEG